MGRRIIKDGRTGRDDQHAFAYCTLYMHIFIYDIYIFNIYVYITFVKLDIYVYVNLYLICIELL